MLQQALLYIRPLLAIILTLTNYKYSNIRQFYIKSRSNTRRLLSLILKIKLRFLLG
jgi:hypothetical protein